LSPPAGTICPSVRGESLIVVVMTERLPQTRLIGLPARGGIAKVDMDNRSEGARSALMARVRNKNTEPEIFVRRLVHRLGYRFRLHRSDLPGVPDLVLRPRRKAIFVHGCFWHNHGCATGQKLGWWPQRDLVVRRVSLLTVPRGSDGPLNGIRTVFPPVNE